jgi:thiamine biosynthesis lipoprotein ApbE
MVFSYNDRLMVCALHANNLLSIPAELLRVAFQMRSIAYLSLGVFNPTTARVVLEYLFTSWRERDSAYYELDVNFSPNRTK